MMRRAPGNCMRGCWTACGRPPGVIGATVSAERLLSGYSSNGAVRIEGRRRAARVDLNFVGPEFFETMQIPIAMGRSIGERDMTGPAESPW